MKNPQETPKKEKTPLQALEAIGKVMTVVDMPVKEFKRKDYELLKRFIIKMIKDGVVISNT